MQIVIDIPDKEYEEIIDNKLNKSWDMTHYERVIANGIPLPKGHGRILDEKDILDTKNNDGGWYDLIDMPEYIAGIKAIIEADKAERNE